MNLDQVINLLNYFKKDVMTFESLMLKKRSKYNQGLFNMDGDLLNYIFGTATMQEVQHVLDGMKDLRQQDQSSHSLSNQVTYMKRLDN
jgi:hypothetical protein